MLSKSLALRILGLNFFLVILPLLVYFSFFLHHEYRDEVNVNNQRFKNLALSRATLLEQEVNNQYTAIPLIADLLNLDDKDVDTRKDLIENKMKEIANKGDYSGIVFFRKDEQNRFIATFSAKQTNDGKDFSFREYVQLAYQQNRSTYLAEDVNNFAKELLVSQVLRTRDTYAFLGILTVFYNPDKLIELLVRTDTMEGIVRISLLSRDKIVFASSDSHFLFTALAPISAQRLAEITRSEQFGTDKIPKITLQLEPYSSDKNVFTWQEGQVTRKAIIVPVEGTEFFILVDIDNDYFFHKYLQNLVKLLLIIAAIVIVASLTTLAICQWLYRPLRSLILTTNNLTSGNFHTRYTKMLFGCEINDAGRIFNTMVENLTEKTRMATDERIKTETVAKELKLGHEIQSGILPNSLITAAGIDIAGMSLPAREVGGDFYDVLVKDNQIYLSISSTSGKGILACFYAICLRSMLRSFNADDAPLDTILGRTNELFYHDVKNSGLLIQTLIASWHQNDQTFTYAGAGLSFGFVIFKEEIQNLVGSPTMMGIEAHATYSSLQLKLTADDIVVLYTKGVIEAQNPQGYMYGEETLKQLFRKNRAMSASSLVALVKAELASFSENSPQDNDMTLVVIKVHQC